MEQKIILLALVAGILFLAGCTQETGSLAKRLCESTGGTVTPGLGHDFGSCSCPAGTTFAYNFGCIDSSLARMKQVCENSGGTFNYCPPDSVCKVGTGCQCLGGKSFDSKYGCIDPQTLATARLCDSTGGRFNYCTVEACISSCICNPGETFDSTLGCIALTPEFPQELLACKSLCENTGGIFCSNYSDAKCTTIELLPGCACPDASTAGCGVFIGQGGCNNTG